MCSQGASEGPGYLFHFLTRQQEVPIKPCLNLASYQFP